MKKILVFLLISLLAFSSIAFASVNGDYKGYPKVNVNVDGQKYIGEVPAIMFNGTTMVPVRFVGESLGSTVKWDNNSYTVSITNKGVPSQQNVDIAKMKEYSLIADYFTRLEKVGATLRNVSDSLFNSYMEIETVQDIKHLAQTEEIFNNTIDQYNNLLDEGIYFSKYAKYTDLTGLNEIMQNYSSSIENYKVSINALYDYVYKYDDASYKKYSDSKTVAFNAAINGSKQSYDKYQSIFNMILSY